MGLRWTRLYVSRICTTVISTWTDSPRPPTAFMDSHLTAQSSTVFRSVHSLIYIFDAESPELLTSDTVYFLKCLRALRDQNPPPSSSAVAASSNANGGPSGSIANGSTTSLNDEGPTVFVLLHKMDLVPVDQQASKLAEFEGEVTKKAREGGYKGAMQFYGTSIWNETLYKVRQRAGCSSIFPPFGTLTLFTAGLVRRHGQPDAVPLLAPDPPEPLSRPLGRIRDCPLRANDLSCHFVGHARTAAETVVGGQ